MRKLILASHGSMAEGLRSAAAMILGDVSDMTAYGLDTWITPQSILDEIRVQMEKVPNAEYIILCDIKGGSVHNCLLELFNQFNLHIFTGMNLSLVLELSILGDEGAMEQEAAMLLENAKNNLCYYNRQVLKKIKEEEGEDNLW